MGARERAASPRRRAEGAYAGFTGVEEQEWEDWMDQVYGDAVGHLAEIKAEYDPENVFDRNVNVDPTDS